MHYAVLILCLQDLSLVSQELFFSLLGLKLNLLLVDPLLLLLNTLLLGNHKIVFCLLLVELVLDLRAVKRGLAAHIFTELGLQVLEKRPRANLDTGDLDGLEPDAPALDNFEHLLANGVT